MAQAVISLKNEKYNVEILRVYEKNALEKTTDVLAVEEPLEIRLGFSENGALRHQSVSITMRTPGEDEELAAGFLFTEGVLESAKQISKIKHCGRFPNNRNTIRIDLHPHINVNLKKLERNFYTTSSCGVCGKTSLEALIIAGAENIAKENFSQISTQTIHALPEKLRAKQAVFEKTGGLHAAAIFDFSGNLIDLKEDVGRHNAVDKLIGKQFVEDNLPLTDKILFLSGRASFELLQKAVMAQIPVVCAVGAPSSLAVEAAKNFNVTLIGFVRESRFNIYTGNERIIL